MALISCRECGAQISDMAAACPHCGCPVAQTTIIVNQSFDQPYEEEYEDEYVQRKKQDSPLSIAAAVCSLFTITWFIGIILGLIDIGAFSKDGKRHLGSWFAVIWGIGAAIVMYLLKK